MILHAPASRLQFLDAGELQLESGRVLERVTLAYETYGTLAPDGSNAVLIQHALTANSHVAAHDDADEAGWWGPMVGPGASIDTDRYFVVCANMLGGCGGTTGPASTAPGDGLPYGSRFPGVTLRDGVTLETRLADHLGIAAWHTVIGGSMGGARALEWAVMHPERVERLVVLAAPAYSNADQIAWAHTQLIAIESDPEYCGGDYLALGRTPENGLGLARRIAHLTYRHGSELDTRFGRERQRTSHPDERPEYYQVDSYLDHQARKLVNRFDAGAYAVLTRALRDHDITRGRGGLQEALGRIQADVTLIAIDTDRLYPPAQLEEIDRALASPPGVHTIRSLRGHDGFLMEHDQLAAILGATVFA